MFDYKINYSGIRETGFRYFSLNILFRPARRRFTKSLLSTFILGALFFSSIVAAPPTNVVRGMWVIRHNLKSKQSIDTLLAFAARFQFTDLFVQVRGRGDAYYKSKIEPLAEGLDPDFDPLAYLLEKNKSYPLRIHAWINVFYIWSSPQMPLSPDHIVYKKPEWLAYSFKHDTSANTTGFTNRRNAEGLFHSPMVADVHKYVINIVNDILSQYSVDGLHLDYIRFPGNGYGFSPDSRNRFKKKYHFDPIELYKEPDSQVINLGAGGYEQHFSAWGQYLRKGLSEFVKSLANDIHYQYPNVIISAAVKPAAQKAYWRYYQEWDRWLAESWIDWAIPMNYSPNKIVFQRYIDQTLKANGPNKLLMGIALYNQPVQSAIEKILMLEKYGLVGFVLFSYDQISKDSKLQRIYKRKILHLEGKK